MKIIVIALFIFSSAVAQTSNPIATYYTPNFGSKVFNPDRYTADIMATYPSGQRLSLYNPVTGIIDTYSGVQFGMPMKGTMIISENLFRGIKIDSFNPNGACNFTDAIASGLLNLLFNGNDGSSAYIRI